jgi:glycogen phosphorylase
MANRNQRSIAYFSMEIVLDPRMPTYAGGLGVLAGDTIRSAADLEIPMLAVSLLQRKGYFRQQLDANGWQTEQPDEWPVEQFLEERPERVSVRIEGRNVAVRAWLFRVKGLGGYEVPVYLLDTDLEENSDADRRITDSLYGGDQRYRLTQEVVLGVGGVRILGALGHRAIERYHMNEGHASLLTLELLNEEARKAGRTSCTHDDIEAVRQKCIFTTHTPVPAGQDHFPVDLMADVTRPREDFWDLKDMFCVDVLARITGGPPEFLEMRELLHRGLVVNLTYLALNLSHYVNGVAKKHGEISQLMFAGYHIEAITNGVHAATWAHPALQQLYDRYIPGWRQDNFALRAALSIPREEIAQAHRSAKQALLDRVARETGAAMDPEIFTIGFARRATAYKRAGLLFTDPERLKQIAERAGGLQIIYAGKAHPQDPGGKEIIQRVIRAGNKLGDRVRVVYLVNYDIELAKLLTSGVDLWLNTPQAPLEASGTSGMKAALNGIPSLSVLDGWWIEGHIEGITGWSIGERGSRPEDRDGAADAESLYQKLGDLVLPLYHHKHERFVDVMRHAIALNGSFFNTQRMLQQYVVNAYFL